MTGYTCHRAERAAGFSHGDGTRKIRQDWSVGEIVNVGFLRGLMVISGSPATGFSLVARNGTKYVFVPHQGISRA